MGGAAWLLRWRRIIIYYSEAHSHAAAAASLLNSGREKREATCYAHAAVFSCLVFILMYSDLKFRCWDVELDWRRTQGRGGVGSTAASAASPEMYTSC